MTVTNPHHVPAKLEGSANNRAGNDNLDNLDGLARTAYERRIERLEQENKELSRKLVDTTKTLQEVVRELLFYFENQLHWSGVE